MAEDQLKLLRQMREIVRARQRPESNHPYQIGIKLLAQEKFGEAAEQFREAVRLNPDFSFAHHYLGNALFEQEELTEAQEAFRQAARLNSQYAATYLYLGKIESIRGNLTEAENHYRRALKLRPGFVEAMFGLAGVLTELRSRETGELVDLLTAILRSDYANDEVLSQLINLYPVEGDFYLELANELWSGGQKQKAILLYRLAMLAEPELPMARLKLAQILYQLGKKDESVKYLEAASVLPHQDARSFHLMGDLLTQRELYTEALAAYRQALKFDPDNSQIYKKIGDVLTFQSQFEDAQQAYRQAVQLGYTVY